jgi:hypothetical protein
MESNGSIAGNASASIPISAPGNNTVSGKEYTDEEVRRIVAALEEPFDPEEIKWRVTNTTADKRRGQMMAYADPRAYTDRLNELFTIRGWTREYLIETINNVERKIGNGSQIVGKVVVNCRVTIYGLGTHSGIGEEWADNENAGTAAEAQAFKRACSCFGLGRYLYDLEGGWVYLDERRQPKWIPKLPDWAIPKKPANGLGRPSTNGLAQNGYPTGNKNGSNTAALRARIKVLAEQVGYSLSRSVLMGLAKAETPEQIPADLYPAVCSKLEDTFRGVERLRAAKKIVGQQRYSQLCRDLNFASDALDDILDRSALRQLIEALEKEAAAVGKQNGASTAAAVNSPAIRTNETAPPATAAVKLLAEARGQLIKEAQRVARLKDMKVADVVNRAAKGAFTFANLQRLTAEALPSIRTATDVLRNVA